MIALEDETAGSGGERRLPPPAVPPILDGKYRLEGQLGEGATGTVFRAVHLDLRRTFALKVLKPLGAKPARRLARFRQEAEALGRLRHRSIVEVTDFGVDDETGTAYLVLEYLEGTSLAERLRETGALPLARALPLLSAIAEAVDVAHAQGILHRDLKPANIFLTAPRGVKILDFGLAELVEPRGEAGLRAVEEEDAAPPGADLTASGALPGTPLYVAPEVIRHGATSRASDIYSLGVLAYEMLAGRPPFQGSALQVLEGHLERTPALIPGLAPGACDALLDLMHKDPRQRPATASTGIRRLRQAARKAALEHFQKTEVPRRLHWAALWTVCLLAAAAWLPASLLPDLDRWLYDRAVRLAPARPPDPRLFLVTLDEESLATRTAPANDLAWADDLGRMIPGLEKAGARGIAVDLLLPRAWSHSDPFSEAVLYQADSLTLAAHSDYRRVQGIECLSPLVAAVLEGRAAALFGFTNLDDDSDGAIRRNRLAYPLADGGTRPSWAVLAARHLDAPARAGSSFRIDHRIDWRRIPRISWHRLPAALAERPGIFADRLVLIGGGELTPQQDEHIIPGRRSRREKITGLRLQSLMVSSLTAERPLRDAEGKAVPLASALAASLGMAWFLCSRRRGTGILALTLGLTLLAAVSWLLYVYASLVIPLSTPLALALLAAALTLGTRLLLPPFPSGSPR